MYKEKCMHHILYHVLHTCMLLHYIYVVITDQIIIRAFACLEHFLYCTWMFGAGFESLHWKIKCMYVNMKLYKKVFLVEKKAWLQEEGQNEG